MNTASMSRIKAGSDRESSNCLSPMVSLDAAGLEGAAGFGFLCSYLSGEGRPPGVVMATRVPVAPKASSGYGVTDILRRMSLFPTLYARA